MSSRLTLPRENPSFSPHPTQLTGDARTRFVIQALHQYNWGIIEDNPEGAKQKFEKLSESCFAFFRGTADLTYRDFQGTDSDLPVTLCMGDVHLENYGVMERDDRSLIWSLNDFDESAIAPFSWDVKRGAISVFLAAREEGFADEKCSKLSQRLVSAYFQHIGEKGAESQVLYTRDNAPDLVRTLIKKSEKADPNEWLEGYLDPNDPQFRETAKIRRCPERKDAVQKMLREYLSTLSTDAHSNPPTAIVVHDVAHKYGSGLSSIGLWRYYVLVESQRTDRTERVILELKQERPSVLAAYVGPGPLVFESEGSRVVFAERVLLPDANPYYGYGSLDGISYLVRQRSCRKRSVKPEKLDDFGEFKEYAKACGAALANAHLRADSAIRGDSVPLSENIHRSVDPEAFVAATGLFAQRFADRVKEDWKSYKRVFRALSSKPT